MDEKEKLYQFLQQNGMVDSSFEEFSNGISSPEKVSQLYSLLSEKELIKMPEDSFRTTFFSDLEENLSQNQPLSPDLNSTDTEISENEISTPAQDLEASEPRDGSIRENVAESVKGVLRTGISGIGQFVESLGTGADQLRERFGDPLTVQVGEGEEAERSILTNLGRKIEELAVEIYPNDPEIRDTFVNTTVPEALGSTIGFAAAHAAGGAPASMIMAGFQMGQSAFEDAKAHGADDDAATTAFLANMPLGGLEAIPLSRFMSRLNRGTGGGVTKVLKEGVVGGAEEAIQEVGQQYFSNVAAKNIYDETRSLTEGLAEGGGAGFAVGLLLNSAGARIGDMRNDASLSTEEKLEAWKTEEYIKTKQEQLEKGTASQEEAAASTEESNTPEAIPISEDFARPGKVQSWLEKWWIDRGNMPRSAFERKLKSDYAVNKEVQQVRFMAKEMESRIKQEFDKGELPQAHEAVNEAFMSGDVSALPQSIQPLVKGMVLHNEAMVNKLRQGGLLEGDLMLAQDASLGTYLKRAYKVHTDPKWAENIPLNVRNKAVSFVRSQRPDLSPAEANTFLNDLLFEGKDAPMRILAGKGLIGGKDYSILRKKGDIAPEIRAFMGEHSDAIVNYASSIVKIANIFESQKFLTDVKKIGLEQGWFYEGDDLNRPEGFNDTFLPTSDNPLYPLAGIHTSPEIKEAFERGFDDSINVPWLQGILKVNGLVKLAKTVGSPATHARNVTGGFGFAVMNGHMPRGKYVSQAFKNVRASFGKSHKEARARVLRLQELGMFAEGATTGEIRGYINDANLLEAKDLNQWMEGIEKGKGVYDKGMRGVKHATKLYQSGDNFMRLIMFESELARYKEALPNTPLPEVEQMAADIVNRTYQNYGRLPKAIRVLRQFPIVGTFASFPAEVMRSSVETINQAQAEVKSDNPAIRKIGYRRYAGVMAMMSLTGGAARAAMGFLGMDDEDDRDMRRFVAPWNEKSSLLWLDKSEDGVGKFIDLSYTDPHEYIKDPIMHMIQGEGDIEKRFAESMGEALEPFLGEEILAERILDISRKTKKNGAPVYNPKDPNRWYDILNHLWEAFEPGAITTSRRIYYGATGKETPYKEYKLYEELLGAVGVRITTVDPRISLKFKALNASTDIGNSRRVFTTPLKKGMDPEEVERFYKAANATWREDWNELRKDYEAAVRQGVPEEEVIKIFRSNRLPKWAVESIQSGTFAPFERDGRNDGNITVTSFDSDTP